MGVDQKFHETWDDHREKPLEGFNMFDEIGLGHWGPNGVLINPQCRLPLAILEESPK